MDGQDFTDLDLPMKIKLPNLAALDKTDIEIIIGKRKFLRRYHDREFSESLISRFYGQLRDLAQETA